VFDHNGGLILGPKAHMGLRGLPELLLRHFRAVPLADPTLHPVVCAPQAANQKRARAV